jgi:hypothetical protein
MTVESRTGTIGSARREDYFTKCRLRRTWRRLPALAAVPREITGADEDLQTYLQRVAGYCLTGITTEHSAMSTTQCSYCGWRFRSSIVRMMWASSVGPELKLDLIPSFAVKVLEKQIKAARPHTPWLIAELFCPLDGCPPEGALADA